MTKTTVVVFRNQQGQIVSWVGRKGEPVARRWDDAKRFAPKEARHLARRYNEVLYAHKMSGHYTAEDAL